METTQDLRRLMMDKLLSAPQSMMSVSFLQQLIKQEGYSVEEIFNARYDPIFLLGVQEKEKFFKIMEDIEKMLKINQNIKPSSKNRQAILLQSEDYLFYFFHLLFTKEQKFLMSQKLIKLFLEDQTQQMDGQSQSESSFDKQQTGIQTILFMLKSVFHISQDEPKFIETKQDQNEDGQPLL